MVQTITANVKVDTVVKIVNMDQEPVVALPLAQPTAVLKLGVPTTQLALIVQDVTNLEDQWVHKAIEENQACLDDPDLKDQKELLVIMAAQVSMEFKVPRE